MVPYYTFPTIPGLEIKPFGLLVGLGVVTGYMVAVRRAKEVGVPKKEVTELLLWTIFPALLGSHIFQVVLYYPHKILNNPMTLLHFNAGISSFGGMFSFMIAFYFYIKLAKPPYSWLLLWDILTQAFLFAWIFGRLGCSLAHDHPGIASNFFLAVNYPDHPRHDLGFYELLYTIFILIPVSLVVRKRKLPTGSQVLVFLLLYAPFRLFADSLRSADVKYFGWTPGQYSSVVLLFCAAWLWRKMKTDLPL